MNKIESLFDTIGRGLTSMGAVLTVMLTTVTGMVFFSHTLFNGVFPATMNEWEKYLATWLMAVSWEATVLITTVNVKHVHKRIPAVMAVCSGFIVLFFIQAFDGTQPALTLLHRWFVGTLAATINYIYADLFYAKWVERMNVIEEPSKVNELQSRLDESESKLTELQSKLLDVQPKLIEIHDLRAFKAKIDKEHTCPHCNVIQSSYGTLHAHKGHCTSNPKNKK